MMRCNLWMTWVAKLVYSGDWLVSLAYCYSSEDNYDFYNTPNLIFDMHGNQFTIEDKNKVVFILIMQSPEHPLLFLPTYTNDNHDVFLYHRWNTINLAGTNKTTPGTNSKTVARALPKIPTLSLLIPSLALCFGINTKHSTNYQSDPRPISVTDPDWTPVPQYNMLWHSISFSTF